MIMVLVAFWAGVVVGVTFILSLPNQAQSINDLPQLVHGVGTLEHKNLVSALRRRLAEYDAGVILPVSPEEPVEEKKEKPDDGEWWKNGYPNPLGDCSH